MAHPVEPRPNVPGDPPAAQPRDIRRPVRRWAYLLLLAPFVGTLWVSTYASQSPQLWGFPFFYWYQFAWVIAAAGITAFVYLITTPRRRGGRPPGDGGAAYPGSPTPRRERSRTR